jgi:predicted DCC family thiol-disulfide oxidoreductase YuxK
MKAFTNWLFPENRWTGGQYSLFRMVFGTYLVIHFLQLLPWAAEMFSNSGVLADGRVSPLLHLFPNILAVCDSPLFVTSFVGLAAVLSVMFAAGWYDRAASLGLAYIWACLFGRNPLIANPGLPYVGLLLVAHACLPRAPYGSLARRGDVDPGSSWRMPQSIFVVVWILMAVGYTYSGATKLVSPSWVDGSAVEHVLHNPLARPGILRDFVLSMPAWVLKVMTWGALATELSFAPLAFFPRLRPFVWLLMLTMHLGLITLIDFADLSMGMVILHLFTFDPGWVRGLKANTTDRIFFDGQCGLCHRAIRFVLAEDLFGTAFRFAPLAGESFETAVPAEKRAELPDSVVVLTADGDLLVRSTAALYIMRRLGGVWRLVGAAALLIPQSVRDYLYDCVAAARKRLFRAESGACPIMPAHLRARFDW